MKGTILIILLSMLLLLSGCNSGRRPEAMINLDKLHFAYLTRIFDFQMVVDGEIETAFAPLRAWDMTQPHSPYFDPFYTELVFVHNKEQAQGFSDNVIVAWPRDWPATQGVVNIMNNMVSRNAEELGNLRTQTREPISLEDFGLTYPITIEDLVDNWEKVIAVWNALTETERMSLRP